MSVNITVNGKFTRHCGKSSILHDPERVKKELEEERRRIRLQQVREESKSLAQQIRKDVAKEKERQLRNLETIKTQELDCWRKHVLTHKNHDYRKAIFHVGMAHSAAKKESESRAAHNKKQTKAGSYKEFQKQAKARRSCKSRENQQNQANVQLSKSKTICTQTPSARCKPDSYRRTNPVERKNGTCDHENACCCCTSSASDDSEEEEQSKEEKQESCSISNSEETSSNTSTDSKKSAPTREKRKRKIVVLRKTPAVIVDVDVDSNDSITITTPCEINDKHVQNNRQFSRAIRVSPTKAAKSMPDNKSTKRGENEYRSSGQKERTTKECSTSPREQSSKPGLSDKPRFTQISDLIQKGKIRADEQITRPKSPTKTISTGALPRAPPPTPKSQTPQKSPLKPVQTSPSRRSRSTSKTSKGTIPPANAATTTATSSNTANVIFSESGTGAIVNEERKTASCVFDPALAGRVQFYDYNNKFAKEYPRPEGAVKSRSCERDQLNAVEEANIEKQLLEAREREMDKLRKKSDERGKRAIEREQVRRDCHLLTEKLENLTRQYPQLIPTDANLYARHRYVDRAVRRETEMNSAVEELLMRPAVITCPEVDTTQREICIERPGIQKHNMENALNLGVPISNGPVNSADTSDSCCSILLDYVNNQTQQVRSDLNDCETNPLQNGQKAKRLKNLLQRIEQLRSALLLELQTDKTADGSTDAKEGDVNQIMNSIVDLRKERESILIGHEIDHISAEKACQQQQQKQHESKMQNNIMSEESMRKIYEMVRKNSEKKSTEQKSVTATKDHIVRTSTDKPLEIIIKVKGQCDKGEHGHRKQKKHFKSPRKVSPVVGSSPTTKRPLKITTPATNIEQKPRNPEDNFYDSGSTSYRSLPPTLTNNVDILTHQLESATQQRDDLSAPMQQYSSKPSTAYQQPGRLNPLVAQYVQQLLSMTKNSIDALGVSSSDIPTPSSSIVNATGNITSTHTSMESACALTEDRLTSVQRFIDENKSFVDELKQVLCAQADLSLETSIEALEEIWRQRLLRGNLSKNKIKAKNAKKAEAQAKPQIVHNTMSKERADALPADKRYKSKTPRASEINVADAKQAAGATFMGRSKKPIAPPLSPNGSNRNGGDFKGDPDSRESDAEARVKRYEQLTTNCTQRISELAELINRVREEKQRIVEVTLSSISETGRNSTEYIELPEDANKSRSDDSKSSQPQSKLLDSNLIQEILNSSPNEELPLNAESMPQPLEKHKNIGISRDSGIAMSRPVTAQEENPEETYNPSSFASTSQAEGTSSSQQQQQQQRKVKPPPTLRRYSPQLLEDDLGHELSTILEVDTPVGTARPNASGKKEARRLLNINETSTEHAPIVFPTFEQYMRQINLDLTQIDPEQSVRIEQEFNELVAALLYARDDNALNYIEFPSLHTYLQNITEGEGRQLPRETSADSIEDLLACLRLANLTVKSFPNRKEYMQRIATNTSEGTLLNTENLGDSTPTETETTESTLNIEAELRRRNILKGATSNTNEHMRYCQIINSTLTSRSDEYAQMMAAESGIEKLSTTTANSLSVDLETELRNMGVQWAATMHRKIRETDSLSSSTSPHSKRVQSTKLNVERPDQTKQQHQCNKEMGGRPLSLRDFLTKELLKHASTSCSCTSSSAYTDDSLRSQFLQSVIESMTPGRTSPTHGVASTSVTADVGGRQKTSTPVNSRFSPGHDSYSASNSSLSSTTAHLFSGASCLSSVRQQQSRTGPRPQPRHHDDGYQFKRQERR